MNREADPSGSLISLLHLLPIGLMFLDDRHQVLLCNDMAKRITQAANPLFVGADGAIALTNPRGHADFSTFLRSAFAAESTVGRYAVHLIMRQNPAVPIAIVAVRCDSCVIAQQHPRRQILLCLRDTMLSPPFDATTLRDLFGYTPAERGLVTALMSGKTLREHADTRGIGENTVRSQLKAVLAKTGLHRQSDLVRVLGSI